MYVDASAIVAILTREPDADALADTLDGALSPITSAVTVFESVLGVCRKRHASVAEARERIEHYQKHGATPVAFWFSQRFPAPVEVGEPV